MPTIEVIMDESLLAEAEQAANVLQMTRLDFIKLAVERALQQCETIALERQDAQAYLDQPQDPEEIEEWQSEQDWGES